MKNISNLLLLGRLQETSVFFINLEQRACSLNHSPKKVRSKLIPGRCSKVVNRFGLNHSRLRACVGNDSERWSANRKDRISHGTSDRPGSACLTTARKPGLGSIASQTKPKRRGNDSRVPVLWLVYRADW